MQKDIDNIDFDINSLRQQLAQTLKLVKVLTYSQLAFFRAIHLTC